MRPRQRSTPHAKASGNGLGVSAGAVIALVAMAAVLTPWQARGMISAETRCTLNEGQTVRAVAAAVAAAARELAGVERVLTTVAAPIKLDVTIPFEKARHAQAFLDVALHTHRVIVAERLLDMPPPTC